MMIAKHVTARLALFLTLAPLTAACGDDEPGQDDASETEGNGETGDGDGDPSTGDGDGDPSTGDGDGDPSTGDGDGDPSTGDGDGDPAVDEVEQACAAACELTAQCLGEFPGCEQLCVESHQEAVGECFDLQLAATSCITTLTCEEYVALMDGQPGAPCEDELAASDACI